MKNRYSQNKKIGNSQNKEMKKIKLEKWDGSEQRALVATSTHTHGDSFTQFVPPVLGNPTPSYGPACTWYTDTHSDKTTIDIKW